MHKNISHKKKRLSNAKNSSQREALVGYMEWKEVYSVRVKELDRQHKRLIDMINELTGP